ncbi:MaoC family dehydratase [Salinirarus marinus]|uniref:MaoC family dehydratase n=1 Tax=Salinirarus marinus TaxID=3068310 RepID=UPI003C6C169A
MGDQSRSTASSMQAVTEAWMESGKHFSNSVGHLYKGFFEANPFFPAVANGESGKRQPAETPELAYSTPEWDVERTTDVPGEVSVGDTVRFTKQLTEEEVAQFARVSGDTNRLHLDPEFAEETRFGRQIVHGTLVSGLISAALARLPGGMTVYLSQDLQFLQPVDVGETVTAVCEVVEDLGDGRYRLTTVVENEAGDAVIDGEAIVLIDGRAEEEA